MEISKHIVLIAVFQGAFSLASIYDPDLFPNGIHLGSIVPIIALAALVASILISKPLVRKILYIAMSFIDVLLAAQFLPGLGHTGSGTPYLIGTILDIVGIITIGILVEYSFLEKKNDFDYNITYNKLAKFMPALGLFMAVLGIGGSDVLMSSGFVLYKLELPVVILFIAAFLLARRANTDRKKTIESGILTAVVYLWSFALFYLLLMYINNVGLPFGLARLICSSTVTYCIL
jgi:hypothetical protein